MAISKKQRSAGNPKPATAPPRRINWAQAAAGAIVGAAIAIPTTLALNTHLERERNRATAVAVACDLMKELKVNANVFQRKRAVMGLVYSEHRAGKDLTSQLDGLAFQQFQTTVYTSKAGSLHRLDAEARNHVYGLYAVLQHMNVNEPGLVERIRKEPTARSWNLGALAESYVLADMVLDKTEGTLKVLCR